MPVAAAAYWFLKLVTGVQKFVFSDLPHRLGFHHEPIWWPVPPLVLAGLAVALTIRYLRGRGSESPADGFKAGGVARPADLPGIALAAVASIGLGAVNGPEAPLIALGGGLAFLVVWLAKRDVPDKAGTVVAATGSFAAISTLLGSPLAGAFLLLEASGLGGPTASAVLIPGLLGAGTGALIFIGFDSLTGHGTYSLAIPHLPSVHRPSGVEFLWAVAIGLAAAPTCWAIRRVAVLVRQHVERRLMLLTPVLGLVTAGLATRSRAAGRPPHISGGTARSTGEDLTIPPRARSSAADRRTAERPTQEHVLSARADHQDDQLRSVRHERGRGKEPESSRRPARRDARPPRGCQAMERA